MPIRRRQRPLHGRVIESARVSAAAVPSNLPFHVSAPGNQTSKMNLRIGCRFRDHRYPARSRQFQRPAATSLHTRNRRSGTHRGCGCDRGVCNRQRGQALTGHFAKSGKSCKHNQASRNQVCPNEKETNHNCHEQNSGSAQPTRRAGSIDIQLYFWKSEGANSLR